MDSYRVDLEELLGFVQRLDAFERRAEHIADSVDGLVAQLGGNWAGAAAEAHQVEHDKWIASATEMQGAAVQLRAAAATAHRNYTGVVEINTAMWP